MSVLYHPVKGNVISTMGSASRVEEVKKDLGKDVHKIAILGVILKNFPNGSFMVHHNSDSSLFFEVKSKQQLDQPLMESKESILGKLNVSFFLGGGGSVS